LAVASALQPPPLVRGADRIQSGRLYGAAAARDQFAYLFNIFFQQLVSC
jgi:hypothetical protein